jgi:hypothetical protein
LTPSRALRRGVGRLSVLRPLCALALPLALAFAGCADGGGEAEAESDGLSSSTSTTGGLTAVIQVLANGTALAPANGSLPAQSGVELTFDGSGSTGAVLEYAWDFGDNSTGSDETETHAFAAGGLFTVRLTVTGLGNTSANTTVRIDVAADLTGTALFTAVHAVEGELPLLNPNSCTNQDIDCKDHVIPVVAADANGTPAVAKRVRITITGESQLPAGDMQVFWRSPEGTTLNNTGASGLEHTLRYDGEMPAGDYVLRVRLFTAALVTYTGTVEVDYVHA